jgi:Domain of unknown function (DUF1825)
MILMPSLLLLWIQYIASCVSAFAPHLRMERRRHASSSTTRLSMALTPVGPFCPFRSSVAMEEATRLTRMTSAVTLPTLSGTMSSSATWSQPLSDWSVALNQQSQRREWNVATTTMSPLNIAAEFTRLRFELQYGLLPDPSQLVYVANRVEEAVRSWERLHRSLDTSNDFQTREYAVLNQVHLEQHQGDDEGTALDTMVSMMLWQADCLRAMAKQWTTGNYQPADLPRPPDNVDVSKMVHQLESSASGSATATSTSLLTSSPACLLVALAKTAEHITVPPFTGDEAAFESPTVAKEYTMLCLDHMNLIELGGQYNEFHPSSKLSFLDRIESIGERWDIFFARFGLLGVLNPDYVQQCNAFLASLGLTETAYRQLLRQSHEKMRIEATKLNVFGTL